MKLFTVLLPTKGQLHFVEAKNVGVIIQMLRKQGISEYKVSPMYPKTLLGLEMDLESQV